MGFGERIRGVIPRPKSPESGGTTHKLAFAVVILGLGSLGIRACDQGITQKMNNPDPTMNPPGKSVYDEQAGNQYPSPGTGGGPKVCTMVVNGRIRESYDYLLGQGGNGSLSLGEADPVSGAVDACMDVLPLPLDK